MKNKFCLGKNNIEEEFIFKNHKYEEFLFFIKNFKWNCIGEIFYVNDMILFRVFNENGAWSMDTIDKLNELLISKYRIGLTEEFKDCLLSQMIMNKLMK